MDIQKYTSKIIKDANSQPGALLQILCSIQNQYSYIPKQTIKRLSKELELTQAHILGVIGFYSFLHINARGKFDIRFSDNITDQIAGSQVLTQQLCKQLNVRLGVPRNDGQVTIDSTSCTGMSDQGPAILINSQPITGLNKQRISEISKLVESNTDLSDWPRSFFHIKDNIRKKGILLHDKSISGKALSFLIQQGGKKILKKIEHSNLRGRGGGGFKTGLKWRMCKEAKINQSVDCYYVVCNADEGEPGTFKDRVLLTTQAEKMIEGMSLCAGIISGNVKTNKESSKQHFDCKGLIYLRGEYRYLRDTLENAIQQQRDAGLLGNNILGKKGFNFDIEIHLGAGAYVCGEESALIESLEGKRGIPRKRPPFPATHGYQNQPTVVNNVETFINATLIAIHGADWFKTFGTKQSSGSKLLSISGDCEKPGIYEYPFGISVRQILLDCGASNTLAVQISGAAGFTIPAKDFDRCIAYEDIPTGGSFMIFNQNRDLLDMVKNFNDFFVNESCGFCTPCRVGSSLLKQLFDKVYQGLASRKDLREIKNISKLMIQTSHCGLGNNAPNSIMDTLAHFPKLYEQRLKHHDDVPIFDLNNELQQARQLTGGDHV